MREELGVIRQPKLTKTNGKLRLHFSIELLSGFIGHVVKWGEVEALLGDLETIEALEGKACVVEGTEHSASFKRMK